MHTVVAAVVGHSAEIDDVESRTELVGENPRTVRGRTRTQHEPPVEGVSVTSRDEVAHDLHVIGAGIGTFDRVDR